MRYSGGDLELLWESVPPEYHEAFADRQITPRAVLGCTWGASCQEAEAVVESDGPIRWSDPAQSGGAVYIAYSSSARVYWGILGSKTFMELGRGEQPTIRRLGSSLMPAYTGLVLEPRGDDTYILAKMEVRRFDGGIWSEPEVVGDTLPNARNPKLLVDPDGTLHLLYYATETEGDGSATVLHSSTEDGLVWNEPDTVLVHRFWAPGTIEASGRLAR